uniref:Calcium uniporter protein n=3 Tax=Callorhinchus milii TaxID=7868 RepID=V9KQG4_CALMI
MGAEREREREKEIKKESVCGAAAAPGGEEERRGEDMARWAALRLSLPITRNLLLSSSASPALPRGTKGLRALFHLRQCGVTSYSTLVPSDGVKVQYRYGLPVISVVLPSRKERCQFIVKPMIMNVGDFLKDLKDEDRGINNVAIFSTAGIRVAATTPMTALLSKNFELVVNETKYQVQPPQPEHVVHEHASHMDDVKSLVHRLHVALHLEDHQLEREGALQERLENLRGELQQIEQVKSQLFHKSEAKSGRLLWGGLALMSTQAGAMAWLTWWVYSWDIMEPVTYFITIGSSMAFYAYFLLTRQDSCYPEMTDRQFLHYFYRGAKRCKFNVEEYNKIREELAEVERDLRRLRDPLQLQLPLQQLNSKN